MGRRSRCHLSAAVRERGKKRGRVRKIRRSECNKGKSTSPTISLTTRSVMGRGEISTRALSEEEKRKRDREIIVYADYI